MSGFEGKTGWYGLTATKAEYWHRYRDYPALPRCGCRSLEDIIHAHVWDAGFTVEEHSAWARITGPGLVDGWTDLLYLAISGSSPEIAVRTPNRHWS